MKPNIYILRIFILTMGLSLTTVACSQENRVKGIDKKTIVSGKKTDHDTSTPLIQKEVSAPKKKQPKVENKIKAIRQNDSKGVEQEKKVIQNGRTSKSVQKATPVNKKTIVKRKVSDNKRTVDNKRVAGNQRSTGKTTVSKKPSGKMQNRKKPRPSSGNGRRFIALKTNIPLDALAVQNLAIEIGIHKHITIDIPVMWSISDIEREHGLRTVIFQPEMRWWLKPAADGGHFFGLHTHAAWFNLKWEDRRYQTGKRPLAGAGIGYGYRWNWGSHWAGEFNLGLGYANMKYDTYYNIENGAYIDTRLRNYWGITRTGLSLVYRF